MLKKMMALSVAISALALSFALALAADPGSSQPQLQTQEQVYGNQMMTPQEREEYRRKIRAAKTVEEREQIRRELHERMKKFAQERGIALPEEPPARGVGMGAGGGRNR